MRLSHFAALGLGLFVLAACAPLQRTQSEQQAVPVRCDEAEAQGVGAGKGSARAIAEASMRDQFPEVRGYLLNQGLRRIRPAGHSTSCKAYSLGTGWVQCTAVTRFCGR